MSIGESAEIKRGVSWSKDQEHLLPRDGTVPVIGIGNVQDQLELDEVLYLSGVKPAVVTEKRVTAGWSLLVGSNGNRSRIGNAVLIRKDADFMFASFLLAARPRDTNEILPEFFYRWLSSEPVQAYLSASSEGTTGLNNLSHSFFRSMKIAYPDPQEQNSIVRILDLVDNVIDCTRTAHGRAVEARDTLIHALISRGTRGETQKKSDAGPIPASWSCEHLGPHIIEGPTNGVYRPESDYGDFGVPIVRIDSFDDGHIHNLSDLRRVHVNEPVLRRYALREGEVIINRVNSLSHIGKSTIVPTLNEPTLFESNMMKLRCGDSLRPDFLNVVLCSDVARRHWLSRAKPAVNQASINQRDVRDLPVPLPLPGEQEVIARIVAGAQERIEELAAVLSKRQVLRKSLMHDLLTGRVRVSTVNAESVRVA
jgi:type I restriction enzyme S subunit